jgi:pimeloyl-ACP methyl ester carboxylesterase
VVSKVFSLLFTLIKLAVLAGVGYVLFLFFTQRSAIYPGTALEPDHSADRAPSRVEQVWLETSFGRAEAWFLDASEQRIEPTIIFAHGNGELIDDWLQPMEGLRVVGINVLLVEFPGYGHSDGRPSRASLRETFAAAYDWVASQRTTNPYRIVAMGRSIGGGVAGDLALDRPLNALILQSTFSSVEEAARERIGSLQFMIRDRFDNRKVMNEFREPVLLLHGIDDEVIPFAHAERLAASRPDLEVAALSCGHNDCGDQWSAVVRHVRIFLESLDWR